MSQYFTRRSERDEAMAASLRAQNESLSGLPGSVKSQLEELVGAATTNGSMLLGGENGASSSRKPMSPQYWLNKKLKKLITPKNNRLLLNEMNIKYECLLRQAPEYEGLICDMKVYEELHSAMGMGANATEAKDNAIANYVRKILYPNLQQQYLEKEGKGKAKKSANDAQNGDVPTTGNAQPNEDADTELQENGGKDVDVDNFPYGVLASFAVNQLLNQWRAEGVDLKPGVVEAMQQLRPYQQDEDTPKPRPKLHPPMKKPRMNNLSVEAALKMNPIMYLNQVAPGLEFKCIVENVSAASHFEFECVIEGCGRYVGSGNKKKDAKLNCAKEVAKAVYNVPYV